MLSGATVPDGSALPPAATVCAAEIARERCASLGPEAVRAAAAALDSALRDCGGGGGGGGGEGEWRGGDPHAPLRVLAEGSMTNAAVSAAAAAALLGVVGPGVRLTRRASAAPPQSLLTGGGEAMPRFVDAAAVAQARAQLVAACAADAATDAATKSIPRLRALSDEGGAPLLTEREREVAIYTAAVCAGRWGEIIATCRGAARAEAATASALALQRGRAEEHRRRLEAEAELILQQPRP